MMETLKKGMSNPSVAVAKYLMHYAEIKEATEEFDDAFFGAVTEYQNEHNLIADGIIGANTWRSIVSKLPTTSTTKNRKSRETCALQILLGITADGIFGTKTKAAVKEYQKNNGLKEDGVVGPATWGLMILGENAATDKNQGLNPDAFQPVNYKQGDSRWGKKMYSNHNDKSQTMANSGCGPTAMADIVATWWDVNVTPYDLAVKSMDWGTRTYDSGTSSTFFRKCADLYKASKYVTTSNTDTAIKCLNEGGYVVVCFGKGSSDKSWYKKWASGGHYCCIWKWDGTYFYVNDPASTKASRTKGGYEEIKNCRKGFYCFWK